MENNTQVSPLAELYLARAMASFRANHYKWNTASYLLINRGQNRSSTNSMTVFYLLSQYELKHVFTLPKAAWLPMVSLPGGWVSLWGLPSFPLRLLPALPCTSSSLDTVLSSQMATVAEGHFGKWHLASPWEARWAWMQRGKGFWLSVAVQVPYAQGQPWTAWVVWSNRSLTAAKILYYLYQTGLGPPQLLWK